MIYQIVSVFALILVICIGAFTVAGWLLSMFWGGTASIFAGVVAGLAAGVAFIYLIVRKWGVQ